MAETEGLQSSTGLGRLREVILALAQRQHAARTSGSVMGRLWAGLLLAALALRSCEAVVQASDGARCVCQSAGLAG